MTPQKSSITKFESEGEYNNPEKNDAFGDQKTSSQRQRRGISTLLSWVATLLVPVVLVLTAVRLLLTPAFIQIEYRTPGFPSDFFGFSLEDRLYWSNIAMDYLLNDEDISFLADLHFPDGSSVYNQRELAHMVDVKNVVQGALVVWLGSLGGLLILGVWAWVGHWLADYKKSLARGGWLTILLVGTVIVLVLLAFGFFFVAFHEIFFPPGTWTFSYSDTLIRLFPERFWRDTFLVVGALSIVGGLLFAYLFKEKPSDRS
jgi:integral membrane protein (TIGR01906 family)